MTSITPENLRAELHRAAGVVAGIAAKLTEQDIKAPSELPGWSRGHVLAHICGIANAMGRQLEYAARGESVELYDGGSEGRNRAIDMAAEPQRRLRHHLPPGGGNGVIGFRIEPGASRAHQAT